MKYIAFCLLLVGSTLAHAGDPLYDSKASAICAAQSYDSDKQTCLALIKGKWFDHRVISICATQNYDPDKRACLQIIANRRFISPTEISQCANRSYDPDKRACLQGATSQPFTGYPGGGYSREIVLHQVNEALDAMDDQNYGKARALLYSIKALLEDR